MSRPDMTFAVDWALSNNYLSIYPEDARLSSTGEAKLITEVTVGSALQPNCRDGDQK